MCCSFMSRLISASDRYNRIGMLPCDCSCSEIETPVLVIRDDNIDLFIIGILRPGNLFYQKVVLSIHYTVG